MVLSYQLKIKNGFKDGYNQVSINGHEPVASVEYTTAEGKMDVYKYAGGYLDGRNCVLVWFYKRSPNMTYRYSRPVLLYRTLLLLFYQTNKRENGRNI